MSSLAGALATGFLAAFMTVGCLMAGEAYAARAKWVACETSADPALRAAAIAARDRLLEPWIGHAGGWVTAYKLAGEQRNPLAPAKGAASAIEGFAWIDGGRCTLPARARKPDVTARIMANSARFREAGAPWTPPVTGGVLYEVRIVWRDGKWDSEPRPDLARSILPPDATLNRPAIEAIPPF